MTNPSMNIVTDSNGMIDSQYYYNQASALRAAYLKSLFKRLFCQPAKSRTRFSKGCSLVLGQSA